MSRLQRSCYAVLLCVLASMAPVSSAFAQVIAEYEYEPDRIYEVRTGLGITTQIESAEQAQEIQPHGHLAGFHRRRTNHLLPAHPDILHGEALEEIQLHRTGFHREIASLSRHAEESGKQTTWNAQGAQEQQDPDQQEGDVQDTPDNHLPDDKTDSPPFPMTGIRCHE